LLRSLPIPLPPYNEQERIIEQVEILFEELDNGIESLNKAKQQLQIYRQSLLKHAFEGKLTAKWREENKGELEPAEQLLERIQNEREQRYQGKLEQWNLDTENWKSKGEEGKKPTKPKKLGFTLDDLKVDVSEDLPELPETWKWVKFDYVSEITGGLTKNQKRKAFPLKMKYLRVGNVYADELRLEEISEIGVTEAEFKKVMLHDGDLLIVEGNGSIEQIGRVAMWQDEIQECGHQNHLIRAKKVTFTNPRFILLFLLSNTGRQLIVKQASSTSGLHTLSISKVCGLQLPITCIAEQEEILSILDEKLSEVQRMQSEIEINLQKSEALRQSILKRAFSGKLVPQDPNDEPASVLLEKIKAEKEAQELALKAAKKKKTTKASKRKTT